MQTYLAPAAPSRPAAPPPARPGPLSVRVVTSAEALGEYVSAWEDLAADALEPNAFYEPWMLLPALRAFAGGQAVRVVLVLGADTARPGGPPLLCGLFPLELRRRYRGLPVSALALWQHPHCYLGTPLLRRGVAREALAAFFGWLAAERPADLLELGSLAGEGPLHQLLVDHFHQAGSPPLLLDCHTRGLFRPAADGEAYVRTALSGTLRRSLKRREARLRERGWLTYESPAPSQDIRPWLEGMLDLEARGWKGEAGTALACAAADRAFFLESAAAAFARGRLLLLALCLNGRAIAYRCSFLSGEGAFAFKTTYDEAHAPFSPGVLLELEYLRRLHAVPGLRWMDSCTAPDNEAINRLLTHRRPLQTLLAGAATRKGELALALYPALRWLKRRFLSRRPARPAQMNEVCP